MSISQNFAFEGDTLNIDFAKCKKLDPRLEFTRASSSATFVNDDGVIGYSTTNIPRFSHSVREVKNLYTYSEQLQNWLVGNLSSINSAGTRIAAPDGSITGNLMVENNANLQHLIYQDIGTVTQGATYTWSIYAKQYTSNRTLGLALHAGGIANFNLSSGTIVSNGGYTARIESVGNGWYRCSITGAWVDTIGRAYALLMSNDTNVYTGDNASGVYLWGGQLEIGSTLSEYIRTTTTTTSSYEISPKGIINEEQRTNLVTLSNSSDLGNYLLDNSYVKRNIEIAPDNTFSADKVISTLSAGTNICWVQKYEPITVNGATYVFSVFLKPGTTPISTINLQLNGGTYQQTVVTVSWETKTIVRDTGSNATITPYSNGWYRISTALTNNGTNNTVTPRVYIRDQGNANVRGHSLLIWGWQVETVAYSTSVASTFPTSYIPSTETFTSRSTTGTSYGPGGYAIYTSAINTARFDSYPYLYANFLLLEPQTINLLRFTESFTGSGWTIQGSLSANVAGIFAPNSISTADKLVESPAASGSLQHVLYFSRNGSNETLTFSIFAKKAERDRIMLQMSNFVNEDCNATYNLSTGTANLGNGLSGTDYVNASADIIPYHDGWFRCILTVTKNAANTTNIPAISLINSSGQNSYVGNGSSGVYIWGAQLETGTSATSYFPALGDATATRTADVYSTARTTRSFEYLYVNNLNTKNWFNNKTVFGSIYIEFDDVKKVGTNGAYTRILMLGNTVTADSFNYAVIPNLLTSYIESYIGTTTTSTYQNAFLTSGKNKACIVCNQTQIFLVLNGVIITRQTMTASLIDKFNRVSIGCDTNGGSNINGTVSRFIYYPHTITLENAIELTKTY